MHPVSACARITSGGLLLMAALVWALPEASGAQANPLAAKRGQINGILRSQKLAGADKDLFTQYFRQFFFPRFAILSKQSPGPDDFGELRKELMIFRMQGKTGDAYNQLIDWTVSAMKNIAANSKFHPAARVNAMLVLGELNEREGVPNPKPLPTAFPLLLAVAQSDRFPDSMKIASMVGLDAGPRRARCHPTDDRRWNPRCSIC